MAPVTIYTKPLCPYCMRAIALLKKKNVEFEEISAAFDREKREEMVARSGGARTYPQIFIGERHIGGSDDLMAIEAAGDLDSLLNA